MYKSYQVFIMSTQALNNVTNNMGPEIKKNLPAKYMRYMSYTYWLTTQLRNADVISAESFNEIMKAQKLYASADVQFAHFLSFDEEAKGVTKAMKKDVRQALKPKKEKKVKTLDPNEPEKKRGRKKKEKVNTETEEDKFIAQIVAAATVEEPVEKPSGPKRVTRATIKAASDNESDNDNVSEVSKSSSEASTDSKKAAKEAKFLKKIAAKEAKAAEKLAAKEAKDADKEAKDAEKLAAKDAKDAEKLALKEAKEAEKIALKEAKAAEKLAAKVAKDAEKLALKQAKAPKPAKATVKPNILQPESFVQDESHIIDVHDQHDDDDDDEVIETTPFTLNGINYLIDNLDNLYCPNSFQFLGTVDSIPR